MQHYSRFFPVRHASDQLDVVPLLESGLQAGQARTLFWFEGEAWDTARVAARVSDIQGWLRAGLGLEPGDRVAVMLGNQPDHVVLIYALVLSGLVWVPVNVRFKAAGVAQLVDHCRPAVLIAEPAFADVTREAITQCRHRPPVTAIRAPVADAGSQARLHPEPAHRAPGLPDAVLSIIYTSGTTGPPKGVIFTHRMLRVASEAALVVADAHDGDRLFLWEPLCHVGGAQMLLAPFLREVELHIVEGFSASRFWEQVAASRATHLHYLGGILDILMSRREEPRGPHTLRVAWGAGVGAQAWEPIERRMGVVLRECYGMTEGSSFATVNVSGKPGSIGRALPWIRVELLDARDEPVGVGELGQIVLSSELDGVFFPGYLDDPGASGRALRGGRLYTGDIARRDGDGDLYFVGRSSDSIRVRGENVSAWEIERIFAAHPAIAAVAAVGTRATIGEQDILLYVQFRPDATIAFPQLAAWAEGALASFQRPRYYAAVEQFEVTPSQRIKKHLLATTVEAAWDRLGTT
ncbi:MAG: AMP-binding protein [Casimicrobiaceae bacterium]